MYRFSSGILKLNGQIIAANQLTSSVEFLSVPITLQDENTLNVTLTGIPGDFATLDVENLSAESFADLNGDGAIDRDDLMTVKNSFGKKTGQPGFDPRADVNGDGVVNVLDLSDVTRQVPAGTTCQ